jgi:hypothetical protein
MTGFAYHYPLEDKKFQLIQIGISRAELVLYDSMGNNVEECRGSGIASCIIPTRNQIAN